MLMSIENHLNMPMLMLCLDGFLIMPFEEMPLQQDFEERFDSDSSNVLQISNMITF